jgi:hypothetical protein
MTQQLPPVSPLSAGEVIRARVMEFGASLFLDSVAPRSQGVAQFNMKHLGPCQNWRIARGAG